MRRLITKEEQEDLLKLYKAHFTSKEISLALGYSYPTVRNYLRGFEMAGIEKFNRFKLIDTEA